MVPDYIHRGVKAEGLLHRTVFWLDHWKRDAADHLPPTPESLDELKRKIEAFLAAGADEDAAAMQAVRVAARPALPIAAE